MVTRVIRNPARQEPGGRMPRRYVPEYRRLNRHPVVMDIPAVSGEAWYENPMEREPRGPRGRQAETHLNEAEMTMDGNVVYEDEGEYDDTQDFQQDDVYEAEEQASHRHYPRSRVPVSPPARKVQESAPSDPLIAPGEYLLMIKSQVIEKGSLEKIRNVITDIVYGQHPNFKNVTLEPDDFIVLQRMNLSFGVLIE